VLNIHALPSSHWSDIACPPQGSLDLLIFVLTICSPFSAWLKIKPRALLLFLICFFLCQQKYLLDLLSPSLNLLPLPLKNWMEKSYLSLFVWIELRFLVQGFHDHLEQDESNDNMWNPSYWVLTDSLRCATTFGKKVQNIFAIDFQRLYVFTDIGLPLLNKQTITGCLLLLKPNLLLKN